MPEYPIRDSILSSINAQEPWPDNVKLFQPYEVEQILLPDNASCLAVQAFLKMCNLPFEVEMRWNAEFMSPSGRVPFIKCGAFVVSELEPIAQFAANKGVSLCNRLSTEEKAEMRAYMSLITNVLVNAELYISWIDNDTFNQVTKVRNSSVYPWPLGWLQTRAKRSNVAKRLKALHWHDKTLDQVLADVEQCCNSLSQRLGDKDYFFGTPTQLDALVYGHIRALLSARGPKAAVMIRPITNALLQLVVRVTKLVDMKLTSQEEYLLKQACIARRHISPLRTFSEKNGRPRRSRMSVRRSSGDSAHTMNVFGFKPFASKKIIIMTSKEGGITCKYDQRGIYGDTSYIDEEEYNLVIEIVEDLIEKVEEVVFDNLHMNNDKNSFEILAFPNQTAESYNESYYRLDDSLEPLKENDITERSISFDATYEDVIHVINEDPERDSDLEDDKRVFSDDGGPSADSPQKTDVDSTSNDIIFISPANEQRSMSPDLTDSSKNHCPDLLENSGGEQESIKDVKSSSTMLAESKTTTKFPSDGEMSVENLISYLKQRSALYAHNHDVADVD